MLNNKKSRSVRTTYCLFWLHFFQLVRSSHLSNLRLDAKLVQSWSRFQSKDASRCSLLGMSSTWQIALPCPLLLPYEGLDEIMQIPPALSVSVIFFYLNELRPFCNALHCAQKKIIYAPFNDNNLKEAPLCVYWKAVAFVQNDNSHSGV